ncbi:MAG: riboflavin synthase, partial [Candidatus Omnitrophica bacterium]|nr:riboflavin synthase [Candidatus Omnitrophota bacterium]
MFTGIVEELGVVKRISQRANIRLIEISSERTLTDVRKGDSLAVNGVCLTAVEIKKDYFAFEVMPQTLKVTNLGNIRVGDKVNLERSLKMGDRISGHFVLGHIDCLGIIRKKNYAGANLA